MNHAHLNCGDIVLTGLLHGYIDNTDISQVNASELLCTTHAILLHCLKHEQNLDFPGIVFAPPSLAPQHKSAKARSPAFRFRRRRVSARRSSLGPAETPDRPMRLGPRRRYAETRLRSTAHALDGPEPPDCDPGAADGPRRSRRPDMVRAAKRPSRAKPEVRRPRPDARRAYACLAEMIERRRPMRLDGPACARPRGPEPHGREPHGPARRKEAERSEGLNSFRRADPG
jgi:hypothetical protein